MPFGLVSTAAFGARRTDRDLCVMGMIPPEEVRPTFPAARRRGDGQAGNGVEPELTRERAHHREHPAQVAADSAFRNARQNSDDANARIEHDKVLARLVAGMVKDDAELFKQSMDNEGFKRWMTDRCSSCEQARAAAGTTRSAP